MLHIILAILKIIGIIVAILLLLLLAAFLSILFIPVRYRLMGNKEGQEINAGGKISWFFHTVSVWGEYQNGEMKAVLRILWFKKNLFPVEDRKSGEKTSRRPSDRAPEKAESTVPAGKTAEIKVIDEVRTSEEIIEETEKIESEKSKTDNAEIDNTETDNTETDNTEELKEPTVIEKTEEEKKSSKKSWKNRILDKLRAIKKFLLDILEKIKEFLGKLKSALKKGEDIKQQVSDILTLIKDENTKAIFVRFKNHFLYLWKHVRPDRIKGWIHYGFEDPSLTGWITGIIYLILPISCYKVRLEPDFENKICEGRLQIWGHIRMCHLLRIGWKIFRDKPFRKLLKRVRA